MNTWCPIWSGVTESSVWDEPDYVCKVFVTMLARKDSDHIYRGNAYNLGRQSRKSEKEVLDALKILSSPDGRRIEKQEFNGRRIESVEDGWLILNGEKYRQKVQEEMRKARWRRAQTAKRRRAQALQSGEPITGEVKYDQMARDGATEPELDQHVANNLPVAARVSFPASAPAADPPVKPVVAAERAKWLGGRAVG